MWARACWPRDWCRVCWRRRRCWVSSGPPRLAVRADGLAALGDPGDEARLGPEQHPGEATGEDAVGDVEGPAAGGGKSAEEVACGGARGQLLKEFLEIGGAGLGVHQGGMGFEAVAGMGQGLPAGEQAEGPRRQVRDHQHQGGLVKVLDAAGRYAHPDGPDPGHAGQGLLQLGEQALGGRGVVVGEIAPAQGAGPWAGGAAELAQAIGQGGVPVWMAGVGGNKAGAGHGSLLVRTAIKRLDNGRRGLSPPSAGGVERPCRRAGCSNEVISADHHSRTRALRATTAENNPWFPISRPPSPAPCWNWKSASWTTPRKSSNGCAPSGWITRRLSMPPPTCAIPVSSWRPWISTSFPAASTTSTTPSCPWASKPPRRRWSASARTRRICC